MNYTSEDFHLQYLPSYTLYVQSDIHTDHLVVVDSNNVVLMYLSYDNANPPKEASRILSLPFSKVYAVLPHQNIIWVPSEIFEPTDIALYSDYFVHNDQQYISYKDFKEQGITALYQIDPLLYNRWTQLFPHCLVVPSFEAVLGQAFRNIDFSTELLGVHLYGSQADIFLYVNGEMRIYNTYEVRHIDDLSYFVLSIMKNFAIEGKLQKIVLSGAPLDSVWGKRLAYYTRHLFSMKPMQEWVCENEEAMKVVKQFNTLVDIAICE